VSEEYFVSSLNRDFKLFFKKRLFRESTLIIPIGLLLPHLPIQSHQSAENWRQSAAESYQMNDDGLDHQLGVNNVILINHDMVPLLSQTYVYYWLLQTNIGLN
jgi:hypothetical protein